MLGALLVSQPAEDCHRDGRQGNHEEGVELLELLREDVDDAVHMGKDGIDATPQSQRDDSGDELGLLRLGLEHGKQRVDADGDEGEGPDIETYLQPTATGGSRVVAGKPGERLAVLVECHPEEDDDGKNEAEGHDAVLGLLRGELDVALVLCLLLGGHVGMLEPAARSHIDGDGDNQRHAGHGKAHVVGRGEVLDVVVREVGEVHAGDAGHLPHELLQLRGVVSRDGAVEELVCQRGDVGLVDEAGLGEEAVGDGCGGSGGKHGADVDGHVEEAEGAVAFRRVLRVVVEVTDEHLQVAFEQARTYGDEEQGTQHQRQTETVGSRGDGEADVARKHDADAGDDALAVAVLVGQDAAYDGHEIDQRQEDGVNLTGCGSLETELGLEEQHEDG